MQASADCLNRLQVLGYTWDDTTQDFKSKASVPSTTAHVNEPRPIILSSSSSSDSEDNIPLSCRIKRAKLSAEDSSSTKPVETTEVLPRASPPTEQEPLAFESPADICTQPEQGKGTALPSRGTQPKELGTPPEKACETTFRPGDERVRQQEQIKKTNLQGKAGKQSQPEVVIDLEEDRRSDMQFVTEVAPAYKRTSIKKLQKTNPALAKAVQERSILWIITNHAVHGAMSKMKGTQSIGSSI